MHAPDDVVVIPSHLRWRKATDAERARRVCLGATKPRCSNQVSWMLNRGIVTASGTYDAWWGYCDDHLYGAIELDGELCHVRRVVDTGWDSLLP